MDSLHLKNISSLISQNVDELRDFLKSISFSRALRVGIAVTVPIILGLQFGHFEIAIPLCFGAFWSSPSDVSGSYHYKKNGVLFSAGLVTVISYLGSYLHYGYWYSLLLLGFLSFCISYISIYGFRASLVSFSGLLALVLSFAHNSDVLENYEYALLIGLGGLWYLLLTKIWHRINPKAEIEKVLSDTFLLTAKFLETRGKLVGPQADRNNLQTQLYNLKIELTQQHAVLREALIQSRKNSGRSHYKSKRLLVFVLLVEMLETAIANPVDYDKMERLFHKNPQIKERFQEVIFELANQLLEIVKAGNNFDKIPDSHHLTNLFNSVQEEIIKYNNEDESSNYEGFIMLQNLFTYQEKQFKKLKKIKWLLGNPEIDSKEFIAKKDAQKFLIPQDYDPKLLIRNFSFQSNIFKHSLRLSVTLMIGYIVGNFFDFQNPYWVLLTIIVILRPSYGLTKTRSKDRIIGTIIGSVIAIGMVFIVQNTYILGALGLVSLIIAFSMVQKNYKASATFITLSVVFIYANLEPNILTVIEFRVLDTVVGALLSLIAMLIFWPTWEFVDIKESIEKSVKSNQEFLQKISDYYKLKGSISTSYKVARKTAFLDTSNLSSAFQRMVQEPKNKQKEMDKIYELVVLDHTFLASLASLSTYIQNHKTTEASKQFDTAIEKIENQLKGVLKHLNNATNGITDVSQDDISVFEDKIPQLNSKEFKNITSMSSEEAQVLQEAHLVWEQLQWLFSISRKMQILSASLKLD